MLLTKLTILNYKNIAEATLTLSEKLNCFLGYNGAGKTNILDAVYYLSFCKSAFTSIDSQNVRHGEQFFMIEGDYTDDNGEKENIQCAMRLGTKKHFRRNKKDYKKYSSHIGLIPLIMLSPSDSYLIEGANEERRKLMDIAISQYDSTYIDLLNNYNKALQQRNALLKIEDCDPELLTLWEEQMAQYGEELFKKRDYFIEQLIPLFQKYYEKIADGQEQVSLCYKSHCQRGPLLDVIQRDRAKDIAVGYSLHGIHRDDIEMHLDGFPIRREGSQGQNKTYIIALKLAQYSFLRTQGVKTKPILLLDDIFDKLDANRVERIVSLVASDEFGQIFITDTNSERLDKIIQRQAYDHKLFNVENGSVIKD
ncbi:MAG: DNA replication and repair protein RecF [Bacteroidaceae bacterium]|nr:DNA replication and repair protein RecF [Bacteroidaceae bacterium]